MIFEGFSQCSLSLVLSTNNSSLIRKNEEEKLVGGKIEKNNCLSQMLDAEAVLKMIVQITRIYPSWGKKFVILL